MTGLTRLYYESLTAFFQAELRVLSYLLDDLLDVLLVVLRKPSRALEVLEEADRCMPVQRWSRHGNSARVLNRGRS